VLHIRYLLLSNFWKFFSILRNAFQLLGMHFQNVIEEWSDTFFDLFHDLVLWQDFATCAMWLCIFSKTFFSKFQNFINKIKISIL
jgi:hypothetical protein